jgi:hypothetical protein
MSYFKNCWNSNPRYYHFTPGQLVVMDTALKTKMDFVRICVVTADVWENDASSNISVSGARPSATTALVCVELHSTAGNYSLDLVGPSGGVFHLQSPADSDWRKFPRVDKAMCLVNLSALAVHPVSISFCVV